MVIKAFCFFQGQTNLVLLSQSKVRGRVVGFKSRPMSRFHSTNYCTNQLIYVKVQFDTFLQKYFMEHTGWVFSVITQLDGQYMKFQASLEQHIELGTSL